jgi:hypothetical protein
MGICIDTTCNRIDGETYTHIGAKNIIKQELMDMSSEDLRVDPRANGSVKLRE